jgi:hypothetical protein
VRYLNPRDIVLIVAVAVLGRIILAPLISRINGSAGGTGSDASALTPKS